MRIIKEKYGGKKIMELNVMDQLLINKYAEKLSDEAQNLAGKIEDLDHLELMAESMRFICLSSALMSEIQEIVSDIPENKKRHLYQEFKKTDELNKRIKSRSDKLNELLEALKDSKNAEEFGEKLSKFKEEYLNDDEDDEDDEDEESCETCPDKDTCDAFQLVERLFKK